MEGPTAPVKKEEEEAGADVRGLIALPTGLHGCRPTMTLYALLSQVRISVAALAANFLDKVGGLSQAGTPMTALSRQGPTQFWIPEEAVEFVTTGELALSCED